MGAVHSKDLNSRYHQGITHTNNISSFFHPLFRKSAKGKHHLLPDRYRLTFEGRILAYPGGTAVDRCEEEKEACVGIFLLTHCEE